MVSSRSISGSKSAHYSMHKLFVFLSIVLGWSLGLSAASSHAIQTPAVSVQLYNEYYQHRADPGRRRLAAPPTSQPSSQPTRQPSRQPSNRPTGQPSSSPTAQPSRRPSGQPSHRPTSQPSVSPSSQPSTTPTGQPNSSPSSQPSRQPSGRPTGQPSSSPSSQPSRQPSTRPSGQPSGSPSSQPSVSPSGQPSTRPTRQPSSQPTSQPSVSPTTQPTGQPIGRPSGQPSSSPTSQPSTSPTSQPSCTPTGQPSSSPTTQPSGQPSAQPSSQPVGRPSAGPSNRPSSQPTSKPTRQPSSRPSSQPSRQPSGQPSHRPTSQPSSRPSSQPSSRPSGPSNQPSGQPSSRPTSQPFARPSSQPSRQPSSQPSSQPVSRPTGQPSAQPSGLPSAQPSAGPSAQPSSQPTTQPSLQPFARPTSQPSTQPSSQPSQDPSVQPSARPSSQPSAVPSGQPSMQPSSQPSRQPSGQPSSRPTMQPSSGPSSQPSSQPSRRPTGQPTTRPTAQPSAQPSSRPTMQPSVQPSSRPTTQPSARPSSQPSSQPTSQPSGQPTGKPSAQPSSQPSAQPSGQPSSQPSGQPTCQPSVQPTARPSAQPSDQPSTQPTGQPSAQPSGQPVGGPTAQPSSQPSMLPSAQPSVVPTMQPSTQPSSLPTNQPSSRPSAQPSAQPSMQPSMQPSTQPSTQPSCQPSAQPSALPSSQPSFMPSSQPSAVPSSQPSVQPSSQPSARPSAQPSSQPTTQPSTQPSSLPSCQPSSQPSVQPSTQPSSVPSMQPSTQPTSMPSSQPTTQPSSVPSTQPSSVPSCQPSVQPSSLPTAQPSAVPSAQPSTQPSAMPSMQPSSQPSSQPTNPTSQPTSGPSSQPSSQPSFLLKVLQIELVVSSVYVDDSVLGGLTVAWTELPSQAITLSLYFEAVNTSYVDDLSLPYVYPPSLTLTSTSTGVGVQSFTVIGGTHTGTHSLRYTLTGASIREYRTSSEGHSSVQVVSRSAVPSVPVLVSAVFSFDGSSVIVTFDAPTDQGGYGVSFVCASVLQFAGSGNARCQWSDNARIVIYPVYSAQLSVLSVRGTISVVANTIRALCDVSVHTLTICATFASVSSTSVLSVLAPTTPTKPVVSIVTPSQIGACSTLSVDVSASAGAAGRPWARGYFEVSSTSTGSGGMSSGTSAAVQLQSYLTANFTTTRAIIVPSYVLHTGISYTIQVVLCNFLEACHFAAKTVSASTVAQVPVVSVLGASVRTVYRTNTLTLTSDAYVQSCVGGVSRTNMRNVWTVQRKVGSVYSTVSAVSVSQDTSVFKLNPYTLVAGGEYHIALTVTSLVSGGSASDTAVVTVLASNLVANIASGLIQSVTVGSVVSVDGSGSVDPDVVGTSGVGNSGLLYEWTCTQRYPRFSPNCTMLLSHTSTSRVSINATYASLNTTSRVTLTVYDTGRTRSASTYTDFVVTGSVVPVLRISSPLLLTNINTAKTFALNGNIQTNKACSAVWSVSDSSIVLSKTALTTTTAQVPATTTFTPLNLVLAANTLPTSAILVFTLTCGNAQTAISVTTNSPPLPGSLYVTPLSGVELVTVFEFNAVLWSDPDLPLTYQFGFVSASTVGTQVLLARSQVTYATTTLPSSVSGKINCTLGVYDGLSASTSSSAGVTVVSSATTQSRQQQILSLITSTSTAATTTSATNLIAIASAVMNDINCTLAPNCTTLHRNGCTHITNTCGSCVSGYIGDSGNKNTACVPLSSAVTTNTTANCTTSANCNSYQYCDTTTHTCVSPLKGCNSNCSSHGTCLYLSTITGLQYNSRCSVDNTKCEAVCSCVGGYSGLSCEMDVATLRTRREVRSKLISTQSNLTLTQDVNADTLSVWSSSLYALALNPYELSLQDAITAAHIANLTMTYARTQSVDADQLIGILQVTDTLASLQRYNYNPHDYSQLNNTNSTYYGPNSAINIVDVTKVFGELVVNNMQLGQNRVTYYYDNFRLDVHKTTLPALSSGGGSNITVSSPQTAIEVLQVEPPTTAVLTPLTNSTTVIGVRTLSVYPRAYTTNTTRFLSTPMYIELSTDSGGSGANTGDHLSTIDFIFPFNAPDARFATLPTAHNVTSNCTAERAVGRPGAYIKVEYYHTCPGSNTIILHNCTGILGTLVSYCPVLVPSCAHLDVSSVEMTPIDACTLLSYNSTYTTCRCPVGADISATSARAIASATTIATSSSTRTNSTTTTYQARRLQTNTQTITSDGTTNMVATASYISANRDDVFTPGVFVVVPDSEPKSFVVVYTLAALWGACIIVLGVFMYEKRTRETKITLKKQKVSDEGCIESGVCMEQARTLLTNYITAVVPAPFKNNVSGWSVIVTELCQYHRYFTLFSYKYRDSPVLMRTVVLARIMTYTTVTMALLALFYHLNSPNDDNWCDNYISEAQCVVNKRAFDPTQSVCSWNYHAHLFMHTCDFKEKYTLLTGFINMLVLTAVCMAVLSNVIDVVFSVLAAPLLTTGAGVATVAPEGEMQVGSSAPLSHSPQSHSPKSPHRGTHFVRNTTNGHTTWLNKPSTSSVSPTPSHICDRAAFANNMFVVSTELSEARERTTPVLSALLHNAQSLHDARDELHNHELIPSPAAPSGKVTSFDDDPFSVHTLEVSPVTPRKHHLHSPPRSPLGSPGRRSSADTARDVLCDAVVTQRGLMSEGIEQTAVFDRQWGLCAVNGDASPEDSEMNGTTHYTMSDAARAAVLSEIQTTDRDAAAQHTKLTSVTPEQGGLLLMRTFFLDLLGRHSVVGAIFANTFDAQHGNHTAVCAEVKALCALLVLSVNAVLVYVIVIIAYDKQRMWQLCYIVAVGVQVLFDMLVSHSLECTVIYYTIPNLVRAEVRRAVAIVYDLVVLLTSPSLPHDAKGIVISDAGGTCVVNAAPYLFVSSKLAPVHPNLLESALIMSYTTSLPGACSLTWPHCAADEFPAEQLLLSQYERKCSTAWYAQPHQQCGYCVLWCGVQCVCALRILGTYSLLSQHLIVRLAVVIVVCGLMLFALAASKSLAALIVLVVLVGLVLCAVLWRYWYLYSTSEAQVQSKVAPSAFTAQGSDDADNHKQESRNNDDGRATVREDPPLAHPPRLAASTEEEPAEESELVDPDAVPHDQNNDNIVPDEEGEEGQITIWNFKSFWDTADVEDFVALDEESPANEPVVDGDMEMVEVDENGEYLSVPGGYAEIFLTEEDEVAILECVEEGVAAAVTEVEGITHQAFAPPAGTEVEFLIVPQSEEFARLLTEVEITKSTVVAKEQEIERLNALVAKLQSDMLLLQSVSAGTADSTAKTETTVADARIAIDAELQAALSELVTMSVADAATKVNTITDSRARAKPRVYSIRAEERADITELVDSAVTAAALGVAQHTSIETEEPNTSVPRFDAALQEHMTELIDEAQMAAVFRVEVLCQDNSDRAAEEDREEKTARRQQEVKTFVDGAVFGASAKIKNSLISTAAQDSTAPAEPIVAPDDEGESVPDTLAAEGLAAEAQKAVSPVKLNQSIVLAQEEYLISPDATPIERDTKLALAEYFGFNWNSFGGSASAASPAQPQHSAAADPVPESDAITSTTDTVPPEEPLAAEAMPAPAGEMEADTTPSVKVDELSQPGTVLPTTEGVSPEATVTVASTERTSPEDISPTNAAPAPAANATITTLNTASLLAASLTQQTIRDGSVKAQQHRKSRRKSKITKTANSAVGDILRQGALNIGAVKSSEMVSGGDICASGESGDVEIMPSIKETREERLTEESLAANAASSGKDTAPVHPAKRDRMASMLAKSAKHIGVDEYEVTSSIFSSDGESGSWTGSGSGSDSGSSYSRSGSGSWSGSASTASRHKEYKSAGGKYGSRSSSGSSSSSSSSEGEYRSRKYGNFDAKNVNSYKPSSSIFSSDEEEM